MACDILKTLSGLAISSEIPIQMKLKEWEGKPSESDQMNPGAHLRHLVGKGSTKRCHQRYHKRHPALS